MGRTTHGVRSILVMMLPYADPGTPFPWWVVCGAVGTQCDRLDDFVLADEIVACTVEPGLVDPWMLDHYCYEPGDPSPWD